MTTMTTAEFKQMAMSMGSIIAAKTACVLSGKQVPAAHAAETITPKQQMVNEFAMQTGNRNIGMIAAEFDLQLQRLRASKSAG